MPSATASSSAGPAVGSANRARPGAGERPGGRPGGPAQVLGAVAGAALAEADRQHERRGGDAGARQAYDLAGLACRAQRVQRLLQPAGGHRLQPRRRAGDHGGPAPATGGRRGDHHGVGGERCEVDCGQREACHGHSTWGDTGRRGRGDSSAHRAAGTAEPGRRSGRRPLLRDRARPSTCWSSSSRPCSVRSSTRCRAVETVLGLGLDRLDHRGGDPGSIVWVRPGSVEHSLVELVETVLGRGLDKLDHRVGVDPGRPPGGCGPGPAAGWVWLGGSPPGARNSASVCARERPRTTFARPAVPAARAPRGTRRQAGGLRGLVDAAGVRRRRCGRRAHGRTRGRGGLRRQPPGQGAAARAGGCRVPELRRYQRPRPDHARQGAVHAAAATTRGESSTT